MKFLEQLALPILHKSSERLLRGARHLDRIFVRPYLDAHQCDKDVERLVELHVYVVAKRQYKLDAVDKICQVWGIEHVSFDIA